MRQLIILQTVVPDYRIKVFSFIHKNLGASFCLFAGHEYFEDSVKTAPEIDFLKMVKNHFYFKRRILFQTGMWKSCVTADVLVMEMNPRILSNWILLLMRRLSSGKTILWGHAWPRSGRHSRSDRLRHLMRLLADEIIVYTHSQKRELEDKLKKRKIHAAPNALYLAEEMQPLYLKKEEVWDIIYVGRLTKLKKPFSLVEAFSKVLDKIPEKSNLIIVGNGEEKEVLENFISQNKLDERIKLLGHVGDYDALKGLYARSLFSVSPGYVGLSITQSLGFGVPMLISRNENHSPEKEAAIAGDNAMYFDAEQLDAFSSHLIEIFNTRDFWIERREKIARECREKYSVQVMAEPFLSLVNRQQPS